MIFAPTDPVQQRLHQPVLQLQPQRQLLTQEREVVGQGIQLQRMIGGIQEVLLASVFEPCTFSSLGFSQKGRRDESISR